MAGHDYWHTPPELFAVLNDEFGFDLDAACKDTNCLCPLGITEADDALVQPWPKGLVVWCNPPYSKMAEFVYRARVVSRARAEERERAVSERDRGVPVSARRSPRFSARAVVGLESEAGGRAVAAVGDGGG